MKKREDSPSPHPSNTCASQPHLPPSSVPARSVGVSNASIHSSTSAISASTRRASSTASISASPSIHAVSKSPSISPDVNVALSDDYDLDIDHSFTLINEQFPCPAAGNLPAYTGGILVMGQISIDLGIEYGVQLSGSITDLVGRRELLLCSVY